MAGLYSAKSWPLHRLAMTADSTLARGDFDSAYHAPVLVSEIMTLVGQPTLVLDGTLGGGGHSAAFLEAGAHVVGLDRDPQAISAASARLASFASAGQFEAINTNYADAAGIPAVAARRYDAILLDLGISSHQIDDAARGFSFREGAPLDMRMGDDAQTDASEFLSSADDATLTQVFREYGDEPRARQLAREIIRRRERGSFATSDDFVGAIRAVLGPRSGAPEFARLFQAVRIAVNDELPGLARALPALRDLLAPGGVLAIIAYHSGEDRLVKHAFREWSAKCICPPKQLQCTCRGHALGELLTRKAIIPTEAEMARNPRARSAKLRAWRIAR